MKATQAVVSLICLLTGKWPAQRWCVGLAGEWLCIFFCQTTTNRPWLGHCVVFLPLSGKHDEMLGGRGGGVDFVICDGLAFVSCCGNRDKLRRCGPPGS